MLPYLWMLISAASFACMSELAHALGTRCHWLIAALARTSLVLVFTVVLAYARGIKLVFWRPRTLWFRSLTGSVSLLCTFFAFHQLPASDVIAITNMFPIWVAVLSWPLLGEAPGGAVWTAVVSSVVGAWLINQPNLSGATGAEARLGAATATVSSLLSALVVIGLNRLHRVPSQAIVVHFSAVATVFCLASAPFVELSLDDFRSLEADAIGLLFALGASATVGQLFLTKAFAAGQASKVSVVALSQVAMCLAFEIGISQRRFQWLALLGMILIIGPTAWMLWRRDASRLGEMSAATIE